MSVLVITEHLSGSFTDATFELLALGKSLGGDLEAAVIGSGVGGLAGELGAADRVLVVDDPALESFNPDGHAATAAALVAKQEPDIVLVPYTSTGMDMASHIAAANDLPLVSYCQAVEADGGLTATCQLYAGKIEADVEVDGDRAVFSVLAGAASAADGKGDGSPEVETIDNPAGIGGTQGPHQLKSAIRSAVSMTPSPVRSQG